MPDVRPLRPSDRDAGYALSTKAGWNQTLDDWSLWLAAADGFAFGIEDGGVLVATAGAVVYGPHLAWIGCVLTAEAYRGRGLASTLVRSVMDLVPSATSKLDATGAGRPLYLKLGFRDEQEIVRWRREPAPFTAPPGDTAGRPGRTAWHLGPVAGPDAEQTVRATVAAHAHEPIVWDILDQHAAARRLALDLGFSPSRRLTRMLRGPDLPPDASQVWACRGFEWG